MKKIFVILITTITNFFLSFGASYSQEIKANVTVNTDLLSIEAKQYVSTLKYDLENYINNQKFTDENWEGEPIPVDINIYFTAGGNNRYTAKMAIVSRRYVDNPENDLQMTVPTLMITETNWKFEYSFGANLTYNPTRFDNFTSVIDYYMLLVIGFDKDTYEELGGNSTFEKARNILLLGASQQAEGFETYVEPGSFTKYNIISELVNPRYYPFRRLIFSFYVDGIDKLAYNKEEGMKNIVKVIEEMSKFKQEKIVEASLLIQLFFDTHNQTLATLFNGYKDKEFFKNLMYLDPKNSMLYQDAMDGKLK
ncbi:MAG: hypothetical protein CH6_3573 [Candidatus Kapaibacterium sp.]|nr:MAG: hypothetical protein CH6_3573 [Candidatus Kapabacteria bacterium]